MFARYVNAGIEIKGLYMDDLYMWSCYGEQSLLEFAFPIGTSTRFRPVYWLMTYLQMALIGTHVERFVSFNIAVNVAAAALIYYIIRRLVPGRRTGRVTGFISMILYLASRFAYYQIGQALGLMETMALMLALYILYKLFVYARKDPVPGGDKSLYAALTAYFLVAFTHERYIALLPLFYLALFIRVLRGGCSRPGEAQGTADAGVRGDKGSKLRGKHLKSWALPSVIFMIIMAIRRYAIGSFIPAGTGGTEVTETFSLGEAFGYAIRQIFYIFGVNAGPEYLSGLEWADFPWQIKRMVKFSVLFIGIACVMYLVAVIIKTINAGDRKRDTDKAKNPTSGAGGIPASGARIMAEEAASVSIFLCFIALCIGCSSVTVRLEMRWIYVSYAAALIFASYMVGQVFCYAGEGIPRGRIFSGIYAGGALACFAAYAVLSVYTNIFCRGYFGNIYFWENQLRMNSLYEETIEKYGTEGVFGKTVYIVGNSYGMTDFYARTFFKPYDPDKKAAGTEIVFAEDLSEIPEEEILSGDALVLIEMPEESAYRDITKELGPE